MIGQHATAVAARLTADPNLTVYAGPVPNLTQPPYVRLYVSVDSEDAHNLNGDSGICLLRFTTHAVGANDTAARIVADRVRAQLLDYVLATVPGRSCSPIRHESGVPPDVDETTGVAVVDAIDVWTAWSIPA